MALEGRRGSRDSIRRCVTEAEITAGAVLVVDAESNRERREGRSLVVVGLLLVRCDGKGGKRGCCRGDNLQLTRAVVRPVRRIGSEGR